MAIADFFLGGNIVTKTNDVATHIFIHEAKEGGLLWEYEYKVDGDLASSPEKLINMLMRNASKRFPYAAR